MRYIIEKIRRWANRDSSEPLLDRLLEATRRSEVQWDDTAEIDSYLCDFADHLVAITSNKDSSEGPRFSAAVMNLSGEPQREIKDENAQPILKDIFEEVDKKFNPPIENRRYFTFYGEDDLLDRLEGSFDQHRPVVLLVGSGLTAPRAADKPGVPGVGSIVEKIQSLLDTPDFSSIATTTNPYQQALSALTGRRGLNSVSRVVRWAVLEATLDVPQEILDAATNGDEKICKKLEESISSWPLNPALINLGQIIAQYPKRFGTVLTSNFDPLIEISVRKAGHMVGRTVLRGDGELFGAEFPGCHVVHLHGYWYGPDAIHGPAQLKAQLPRSKYSLRRLLEACTLVILAYGGQDDGFTRLLIEIVNDELTYSDVLWTFHSEDQGQIEKRFRKLFDLLTPAVHRGRVALYRGVDCHSLLPRLRKRLIPTAADPSDSIVLPPGDRGTPISHSPFIVGAPIRRDEDFFGRASQRALIRDTIDLRQPVQILGERRMGKTSFLLWLERNAPLWQDYPVAFVWAQGRAGRSPVAFVHEVATALGRVDEVEADLSDHKLAGVEQALEKLLPVLILVDESANLAEPNHGFHDNFLDTLRDFGQRGEMIWISASHRDLRKLFLGNGRTSNFLNDARLITLGQMEEQAAKELLNPLGDEEDVAFALEQAEGFAFGLQWLGDKLARDKRDRGTVVTSYSLAMELYFQFWWDHRDDSEQQLLRLSIEGLDVAALDKRTLRQALYLVDLGLVAEREGHLNLPGRAWRNFIEGMVGDAEA